MDHIRKEPNGDLEYYIREPRRLHDGGSGVTSNISCPKVQDPSLL